MAIKDELDELKKKFEEIESKGKRKKKFRLPFKARIGKRKMREGYVTILIIRDNGNLDFTKEPIIDATFKLNDTIHYLDEESIFYYKGKPFIIQAKKKLTQHNPKKSDKEPLEGKNETYGQKYVMARMESDKLTLKKSMGWGMSIGAIVIVGIIVYSLFTGG